MTDPGLLWLSADWGTTNFRLRLVRGAALEVLAEVSGEQGVASVFSQWKDQAAFFTEDRSGDTRFTFYAGVLLDHIRELSKQSGKNLDGHPVILSGMAGSTIGMLNLPYQLLPCPADGSGLNVLSREASDAFPFPLALVSGMCSADDVMRGEETMLIGAVASAAVPAEGWYVFPGTHSKHIFVNDNLISALRTYMTGEVFALLAEKSILSASVERVDPLQEEQSFQNGLQEGWQGRLLHSVFAVRTSDLLTGRSKTASYAFLSGLLVGHELRDFDGIAALTLVGSGSLHNVYQFALGKLMPGLSVYQTDAAAALIRGQWAIIEKVFA